MSMFYGLLVKIGHLSKKMVFSDAFEKAVKIDSPQTIKVKIVRSADRKELETEETIWKSYKLKLAGERGRLAGIFGNSFYLGEGGDEIDEVFEEKNDRNEDYLEFLISKISNKFLICSTEKQVIYPILKKMALENDFRWGNQIVDIDSLVKNTLNQPENLSLTYLHGKSTVFGVELNSISLYGQNLSGDSTAGFIKKFEDSFIFHNCGLSIGGDSREAIKIDSRGFISFRHTTGSAQLRAIEEIISLIDRRGYFLQ